MSGLLKFKPVLMERIWGGSRLKTDWGYESSLDTGLGECWVVSCNELADSEVTEGEFKGKRLSQLWKEEAGIFGEERGKDFPLLVKILDAKENLSLQVHPDDAYAEEHEGCRGKWECWYILDCPENAELLVGNRAKDRQDLKRMVDEKRWDDLINRVPVKKGDFIRLEPGTLHAITAGVMLLEVQENSDVTYRVYDYDRLQNGKPRQLHIQQSLDVLRVPDRITTAELIHTGEQKNELQLLAATSRVKVWTLCVSGSCRIDVPCWQIASILEGEGSMNGTPVKRGEHLIIPGDCGGLMMEGEMRVNLAQARGG